jgi:uncharacterized protein (TIGR02145 family)
MFNSVTDIEGNVYRTTKIGDQWWMAENLKVTKFPDGTAIPLVTDINEWVDLPDDDSDKAKAYCYLFNNPDSPYGALYTFAAAKEACPTGWHLPEESEWYELRNFISSDNGGIYKNREAQALKSTTGWEKNMNGTDIYGFTALPGGKRYPGGTFLTDGMAGYWRGGSRGSSMAIFVNLNYNFTGITLGASNIKSDGMSVRCLKD